MSQAADPAGTDRVTWADDALSRIESAFEAARDPIRAAPMAKYMRDQFAFLGIPAPEQSRRLRQALDGLARPTEGDLDALARHLWAKPEREYQYAGCAIVARHMRVCGPQFLPTVHALITTKSWWDTVDSLAKNAAGPLVLHYPDLVETMDRWIESSNLWLRRTALLHQLAYKQHTDAPRLFRYCELRAGDQEFFIRKAIGWALREYSKSDPDAVRRFVAQHDTQLSALSKREALLWLNGGRARKLTNE